jgi:hypothetical protein
METPCPTIHVLGNVSYISVLVIDHYESLFYSIFGLFRWESSELDVGIDF